MNNDHDIEKTLEALGNVKLSVSEKNAVRARLAAHMGTPHAPAALPSPLGYFFLRSTPFLAVVLIAVITTSTVAAAEGSLPGDTLYPVKIHVTEEVRAALLTSPDARASWALERAERRVEEAAVLALSDTLSDSDRDTLSAHIEKHVAQATEEAAEDPDPQVRARIEEEVFAVESSKRRLVARAPRVVALQAAAPMHVEVETHAALMQISDDTPQDMHTVSLVRTKGIPEPTAAVEDAQPLPETRAERPSVAPEDDTDARIEGARRAFERRLTLAYEAVARRKSQGAMVEDAERKLEKAEALAKEAADLAASGSTRNALSRYQDAIEKALDAFDALRPIPLPEAKVEAESDVTVLPEIDTDIVETILPLGR